MEIRLKKKGSFRQAHMYAKQALHALKKGETLKIIVDDLLAVTEVPRCMEADEHEVLSVKQKNKTDWEIVIKKQG